MEKKPDTKMQQEKPAGNKVWRLLRRFLVWMIWFVFSLVVILQLPPVQDFLVKRVTRSISQKVGSKVEAGSLRLIFPNKLSLRDLVVEDVWGDTALLAGRMDANLSLNPIVHFVNGLTITDIYLERARVKINTPEGEVRTNWQILTERLLKKSEKNDETGSGFRLDLNQLELQDITYEEVDGNWGNYLRIAARYGNIVVEKIDLSSNLIHLKAVELSDPEVIVRNFPASPLADSLPAETDLEMQDSASDSAGGLRIMADIVRLANGKFQLDNQRLHGIPDTLAPGIMDYDHLRAGAIKISIDSFSTHANHFRGIIHQISFKEERSGFVLDKMAAREALVEPNRMVLNGLSIKTPYSDIKDTLVFKYVSYNAFESFIDEVLMDGRLHGSQISLRDIMTFAPELRLNPFFQNNQDQILKIDGNLSGKVNNLRGRNLALELGEGTKFNGAFSSRNLAVTDEEYISLRFDRLSSNVEVLRQLFPKMSLPDNFQRLGNFDFSGNFDGFFSNFVADGKLRTALGSAEMDMNLNLNQGKAKAAYSGNISMQRFDLGRWMDNRNFGKITFSSNVKNGKGLSSSNASANLEATIDSFEFKGYHYTNARMNGSLQTGEFIGEFSIRDQNIDFSFDGSINFRDSIPSYNFVANVYFIDLKKLNLSKRDLELRGNLDINLRSKRFLDLLGEARVENFEIIHNQKERHFIDSVVITSVALDTSKKEFKLRSEILDLDIGGQFDIGNFPAIFLQHFNRNYPGLAKLINVTQPAKELPPSNFWFKLNLCDTKNFNQLFLPSLGPLQNLIVDGNYNSTSDAMRVELSAPKMNYDNVELEDLYWNFRGRGKYSELDVGIFSTTIGNGQSLKPIQVISQFTSDTASFGLTYSDDSLGVVKNIDLNGKFYPFDSTMMFLGLEQSGITLFKEHWGIKPGNEIVFGKQQFSAKNFALTNGEKEIRLEHFDGKGLRLSFLGFDLHLIDKWWDYKSLNFKGRCSLTMEVQDVFKQNGIKAWVYADSLFVNNDDWGKLEMEATAFSLKSPLNLRLNIQKAEQILNVRGHYNLADQGSGNKELKEEQRSGYLDFGLHINQYPLKIAEYFIGSTLSGTEGVFGGNIKFTGTLKNINLDGVLLAENGAFNINFLKTRYTFDRSRIVAGNSLFNATGTILKDKFGNTAYIDGGISHDHLRNLGFSARLNTTRFLALDTQKGDNEQFYGQAIGSGSVAFTGTFDNPDVYVNATTGEGTKIVIPLKQEGKTVEGRLVQFVDKSKVDPLVEAAESNAPQNEGLSLEMDLSIQETAAMQLIFNEQTGDIINGNGRGNISIKMPRGRDFQMYGSYRIEQGDYLFTLYNLISKNFLIKQGGTIHWTGSPYDAQINLQAEYLGLTASVAGLIGNYLDLVDDPKLRAEANKSTNVNLTLLLEGSLLRPIINFDINFPNLSGEVKNFAENQIRVMKRDQNELNRQVFGLMVLGQFLPSNEYVFSGANILYYTVSEFLSNQLSLWLTGLFSEFIGDGKVYSGIDFDLKYSQYQSGRLSGQDNVPFRGDELDLQLRQDFFNNRLSLVLGGNFDFGRRATAGSTNSAVFVGNDVVLEYLVNPDRSLKLRIYQRLQPDIAGGKRLQIGAGLSVRKEYDSLSEFLKSMNIAKKKVKDGS